MRLDEVADARGLCPLQVERVLAFAEVECSDLAAIRFGQPPGSTSLARSKVQAVYCAVISRLYV